MVAKVQNEVLGEPDSLGTGIGAKSAPCCSEVAERIRKFSKIAILNFTIVPLLSRQCYELNVESMQS